MSRTLAPAPTTSELRTIPGDYGLPWIGYTLDSLRDPLGFLGQRYERYGPVSWMGAFGNATVILLGPEATGTALANKDKAFANGPGWGFYIGPFFDRGLMLMDGGEHLSHRRIMQQAFTNQRLAMYTNALQPAIEAGIANWRPDPAFLVYPAAKKLTLDLATSIFMGGANDEDQARMSRINKAFIACVRAGTSFVRYPVPGGRWRRGLRGRALLEQYLREYLPIRRAGDGEDLFTALCHIESEDGERLADADIVNQMIFLLMAAHDTSTITISTMMGLLGQHQDWQQRCRAESLALGTPHPSYPQIGELKSLDLVMKECLRLVAPVPSIARRTVKDTEVLGHFVPADTMITVSTHFTHHMSRYWPNPETFDPGRFSAERAEDKVHRFAWEPFGGGVHKCLGMYFSGIEIKSVLHQLLLRHDWSVPSDYRTPLDYTALPYPKDGQPVDLIAR
ncbi:MAG TPA: cytochrome P450 [Pseudonocardiaceae bacterium]|jgi:cytochrome P450|nr:cytochrome P450 [Pseudonocardiaceae bacterium]